MPGPSHFMIHPHDKRKHHNRLGMATLTEIHSLPCSTTQAHGTTAGYSLQWRMEEVKETPCDRGSDERNERGKHTKWCQSNSEFEEMALLISLLSPEAKEGCAVLGMRWIGWLTDLRDWIWVTKEAGSVRGVPIVVFFGGCGGLRTGPQVLQYQPGSLLAWLLEIFTQKRWKGRSYREHRNVFFFLEPVWLRQWTLGWVLRAASLLPICWQALATVKWYRFKLNDIITSRHTSTTVWEPLLTGTAFNY